MTSVASLRLTTFRVLERPGDSKLGIWLNYLIVILIILNIIVPVVESVEAIHARYRPWFDSFETFSVLFFTVEYLLRLWSSVEWEGAARTSPLRYRLRYMLKPMALVDLLSILPYYLSMFFALDLRFMRFLRLLRIFKLTRYSRSLDILATVMRNESQSFSMALFILFTVLLLSAGGIYTFEKNVQPDQFGSIPKSMWWAISTLTTVGYGDVTPVTFGGKVFGSMVMIVGIGMVALPTGILSSAFSDELRFRRDLYNAKLDEALADDILSKDEEVILGKLRKDLRISHKDARAMLQAARSRLKQQRKSQHLHKQHRPPSVRQVADPGYKHPNHVCPGCGRPY